MIETIRTHKFHAILTSASLLAAPAFAADPQTAPEDTWVSVSGEVTSVSPQSFVLDYTDGVITVEFDDWDTDADSYKLVEGDKVTVTGKIDDGFFEQRTIEASSAYVESINTYFYADAADEEGDDRFLTITTPIVDAQTVLQGTVTAVTDDDDFTIQSGATKVSVDVEEMSYNPLDDEGYQKVEVGDRVSVAGKFDEEFLDGLQLMATSVVTLSNNP